MKTLTLSAIAFAAAALTLVGCATPNHIPADYTGTPFADERWAGGPQQIPGTVYCAYYDFGGEGVAYHETTPGNQGSGEYNPLDGSYLHAFRVDEGVDTSYTKSASDIDNSPYNFVTPPMELLYIGWTQPGEWTRYTVNVTRTGDYSVEMLYTANRDGRVTLEVDGGNGSNSEGSGVALRDVLVTSTYREDDPVAMRQWHHWNVAPLGTIHLTRGLHLLTLRTADVGQMNYATLEFKAATAAAK